MTKYLRRISIGTVLWLIVLIVPISIGLLFVAEYIDANSAVSDLEKMGASVFINDKSFLKSCFAPKSRDMDIRVRAESKNSEMPRLLAKFRGKIRLYVDLASDGTGFFSELRLVKNIRELEVENAVDEITFSLAEIQSLRELRLHGADFSGTNLGELSKLSHLSFLDLSRTRVDDAGLANLNTIVSLEGLDVSFSSITDVGLASLKGLELKSLLLAKTKITNDSLKSLSTFSNLSELNIDCEKISLDKISSIRHLPLLELTVSFVELDAQGTPTIAVYFPDCKIHYDGAYQQPGENYQEIVESFPFGEIQRRLNKNKGTRNEEAKKRDQKKDKSN